MLNLKDVEPQLLLARCSSSSHASQQGVWKPELCLRESLDLSLEGT